MESQHKIKWTLYVTLASLFIFISLTEMGPFASVVRETVFSSPLEESSHKYVVMFDGGSTGTRIHVFTFVNNTSGFLMLKDEYFEEVKPGLSNFADKPRKAAVSISNLLEKAKSLVPSDNWDETPVALKATAGLRLLPEHTSNSILEEVSKTFDKSPFISNEKSVSVLDGEDEGLYAWYTLNFLLERLDDPNRSVASLDLGGGSTQVTFYPTDFDTLVFSPKEYIINTKIQNKSMSLYTHSYLGLGLMSARLSILELSSDMKGVSTNEKTTTFITSCLPSGWKVNWKLDRREYTVVGSKDDKYEFKNCYDKAVSFLSDTVDQPGELWKREVYALSYYYERAVDLGLIEGNRGISTVGAFHDACKIACTKKKPGKWFLCLDCSYISALLQHGLGFNKNKEIIFANQIDGIETSWGLGAAFSLIL